MSQSRRAVPRLIYQLALWNLVTIRLVVRLAIDAHIEQQRVQSLVLVLANHCERPADDCVGSALDRVF